MSADVILVFGGDSSERRVSVASAQNLASHVPEARLWFWAPSGQIFVCTHERLKAHARPFEVDFDPGSKAAFATLEAGLDDASPADTFLLGLHGGTGEDGTVQTWLEERRLLFTGSTAAASRRAFDKIAAKALCKAEMVRVAESQEVSGKALDKAKAALLATMQQHKRAVLKPVRDGSSAGLFFVVDDASLARGLDYLGKHPEVPYLIEPFLEGVELTVGVVDGDEGPAALPASEVRIEAGRSFDYDGKYLGKGTREITPAEVAPEIHAAAAKVAVTAHKALGLFGYSRTDLIVTKDGPVFLEVNNLPGVTKASFIPQQIAAAGGSMAEFVQRQLVLGRTRYMREAQADSEPVPTAPPGARARV